MPYITEYQKKFDDLNFNVGNQDQLRKRANGGNSILFSYPPIEELRYIEKAKEVYQDKAGFIDISKLLVEFIDGDGWDSFNDYYLDYQDTPHKVFRSINDPSEDLFDLIIKEIKSVCKNNKIPFLVRTGCLIGTGIENVSIMEHKCVMNLQCPLVIFYPSKIRDNDLYFLNVKIASTYRCILVN